MADVSESWLTIERLCEGAMDGIKERRMTGNQSLKDRHPPTDSPHNIISISRRSTPCSLGFQLRLYVYIGPSQFHSLLISNASSATSPSVFLSV